MFLWSLYVLGIMNKIADFLSCLKLESTEWMLSPRIFKQIVYVYRMPVIDMFASYLNHQAPKYLSWTLDPQAVGMDACILSKLEQRSPLHVFSLQSDSKMYSENNRRQGNCTFNNTSMAVKTTVSHATESPMRQASSINTQSTNIETAIVSNSTSPISEQEVSSSRLAFVKRSFKDQKFRKGCAKYYRPHGNLVQKNSIRVLGNNSLAGVYKGRVICFLAL